LPIARRCKSFLFNAPRIGAPRALSFREEGEDRNGNFHERRNRDRGNVALVFAGAVPDVANAQRIISSVAIDDAPGAFTIPSSSLRRYSITCGPARREPAEQGSLDLPVLEGVYVRRNRH